MKGGEIRMDRFPNIDVSKLMESSRNLHLTAVNTNNQLNDSYNQIKEFNRAKLQREEEVHVATLQIAENTKGINDLISLVRQGNEINQQTFELLQEMQTIMTAQSPEEADTIFRRVMGKATQTVEDYETIQTMMSYGKTLIETIFGG